MSKSAARKVPADRLRVMLVALQSDRAIGRTLREEIAGALLALHTLQEATMPTRKPGRPQAINWESAWIMHELVERERFTVKGAACRVLGDEASAKDVESLCRVYRSRKAAGGFWHNPWATSAKA